MATTPTTPYQADNPFTTTVTATSSWDGSAVTSIVVPASGSGDSSTVYVFDGVFQTEHRRAVLAAEHPVQNAANVTDSLITQPFEIVMSIGMSDAMQSVVPNQWTGNYSKSVNCYLTLLGLQGATLLTINTRLNQYESMAIVDIRCVDDYHTSNGLKATITFRQIMTATLLTDSGIQTGSSDRPLQTEPVTYTVQQPTTPSPAALNAFGAIS